MKRTLADLIPYTEIVPDEYRAELAVAVDALTDKCLGSIAKDPRDFRFYAYWIAALGVVIGKRIERNRRKQHEKE